MQPVGAPVPQRGKFLLVALHAAPNRVGRARVHFRKLRHIQLAPHQVRVLGRILPKQLLVEDRAGNVENPVHSARGIFDHLGLPQHAIRPFQELPQPLLACPPRLLRLVLRGHVRDDAHQTPSFAPGRRDRHLLVQPQIPLRSDHAELVLVARRPGNDRLRAAPVHLRQLRSVRGKPETGPGDGMLGAKQALVKHGAGHFKITPAQAVALPHNVRPPQHAIRPFQDLTKLGLAGLARLLRRAPRGHVHHNAQQAPFVRSQAEYAHIFAQPVRLSRRGDDAKLMLIAGFPGVDGLARTLIDLPMLGHMLGIPESALVPRGGQLEKRTVERLRRNVDLPAQVSVLPAHLAPPEQNVGAAENLAQQFLVLHLRRRGPLGRGDVGQRQHDAGEVRPAAGDIHLAFHEAGPLIAAAVEIANFVLEQAAIGPQRTELVIEDLQMGGRGMSRKVRDHRLLVRESRCRDSRPVRVHQPHALQPFPRQARMRSQIGDEVGHSPGPQS